MKTTIKLPKAQKSCVHIAEPYLLNPTNPVVVNLIGAGGTGSSMLTALARVNYALTALNHAGIFVRVFDDDKVSIANRGRQLFTSSEVGFQKAVVLVNRINRFFGTNWKAVPEKYDVQTLSETPDYGLATITISCVDTVAARFEIASILEAVTTRNHHYRSRPSYWMDFGNSQYTGQVVLSTTRDIKQPASKKYKVVPNLPLVTTEFKDLLIVSEMSDNTPSCSIAEALEKQDLFINSALADLGASLLWQMFREGMIFNRGFFLNLKEFRTQPLKVG